MNTTRRYFELKNQIVEAINRAELPPVMADAALREVRGQVLQAMERELREGEGAAGEPSQSPTATALPKGEPSAESRKGG